MEGSDIKLLAVKCKLLSEIDNSKRQIDFHITQGAMQIRKLLQECRTEEGGTLNQKNYDEILNYLLSVERESMYNYQNNSYLKEYYSSIETKQDILKHL